MALATPDLIAGLADGRSLAEIAAAGGVTTTTATALWQEVLRGRLPPASATLDGPVTSPVEVMRDRNGVPHIFAETEGDLFVGLGFAMAQDRLWQMDYLRRKATGHLAELLGPEYVEQDYLYRILDFPTVCQAEYARLGERWRTIADGMAAGINRAIAQAGDSLPVEFDLLGYRPAPWSPIDILVGLRYQWWGLSGRLYQITSTTLLERALGDEMQSFLKAERDDLYIVPDGRNAATEAGQTRPVRDGLHASDQPHGSNNWVIAGQRTRSGRPLLANDPHYTYSHAHGQFYACHLSGAGHSEAGFVFTGTPGMMTGMNDRIAWGFTNNGTTIRDLYAEVIDPNDPDRYRRGDEWAPIQSRTVTIAVKGQQPVHKTIRSTAHGPIVNDVIPAMSAQDPPLALRWVGFEPIDDLQAIVGMNTATDWSSFRAALEHWSCSVTNFIYGDVDDTIGYQLSARIPLRGVATTGVRPAWQADHEWQGYIPFDGNPRLENPSDGIIATANQRTINPDYRWPMYGAYAGGTRQARILELLRARTDHDAADFRRMQFDTRSLIAAEVTPRIVDALRRTNDRPLLELADLLAGWDHTYALTAVAPAIFETFQMGWTPAYAAATLPAVVEVRANAGAAARRALVGEETTLDSAQLDDLIIVTMRVALTALTEAFGPDQALWRWGLVHTYSWPHPLGQHGQLGHLLNGPTLACTGSGNVINNVAPSTSQPFVASSGPTYRVIADLGNPAVLWINSHCPTSANPASPHFADTIRDWATGNYQPLYRLRTLIEVEAEGRTTIQPG